jgi:hypothetical protein
LNNFQRFEWWWKVFSFFFYIFSFTFFLILIKHFISSFFLGTLSCCKWNKRTRYTASSNCYSPCKGGRCQLGESGSKLHYGFTLHDRFG